MLVRTLAILLAGALTLGAQDPWERGAFSASPQAVLDASKAHPRREGKGILDLLEERSVVVDAQGRRQVTVHSVFRVDEPSAVKAWSEVNVPWSPWFQARPQVRARVIAPDGKVHALDPATLGDYSTGQGGDGLFESRKRLSGPLPHMGTGVIVELEIVLRDTSPFLEGGAMGRYDLWETMPVVKSRLTLDVPANAPLQWRIHGLPGLKPVVTVLDGRRLLTLEAGAVEPPRDREPGEDPNADPPPAFAFSTFTSWAEVARGYAARIPSGGLPPETLAWLGGLAGKEPMEVLAQVLAGLHAKVRYTGVEFGTAAIVPRAPAETLKRGFGDCKDKAVLLVALLEAAGIPARVALVDSGYGRELEGALPGLNVFDHAIVHLPGAHPLWIDATAEFARAGELPFGDQDRPALVIDPLTRDLTRTPRIESAANTLVETREVFLAEKGPSRIIETSEFQGPAEMNLRASLAGADAKAIREHMENYVRTTYKAKDLGKLELSGLRDLGRPMRMTLEALEAKAGATGWIDASVELAVWPILKSLREALDGEGETPRPPRTKDLLFFQPMVQEWRYLVHAPLGFKLRTLPAGNRLDFGPASLVQRYEVRPDGVAGATFRLDSGKRRWTAAEVEAARKAIKDFGTTNRVDLVFDQEGEALLKAGRTREALDAFRKLAATQPASPLPLVHQAQALVAAGLGEAARDKARQAVALDPTSAAAQETLGWTLQFDRVGRRFGKGWDRAGAEKAYLAARALAPREWGFRADYAYMLEHSPEGVRYGRGASLEAAIREYRYLRDTLEVTSKSEQLLGCLGENGQFKEALELARALPASTFRNGWLAAAMVRSLGTAKALEELPGVLGSQFTWNGALAPAVLHLVNARAYADATSLLKEGPQSAEGAEARLALAAALAKATPVERLERNPADPRSVLLHLLVALDVEGKGREDLASQFTGPLRNLLAQKGEFKDLRDEAAGVSAVFRAMGMNRAAAMDVALSMGQFQVDGNAATGFRVLAKFPANSGTYNQTWYFASEKGACLLAGGPFNLVTMGAEALRRMESGDLAGACAQLDWARERMNRAGGEDPLAARSFPYLWTRGQKAGADEVSYAAASLLIWDRTDARVIPHLTKGLTLVQDVTRRTYLRTALVRAYAERESWDSMEASLLPLRQDYPDSPEVDRFHLKYLDHKGRWAEYLALCDEHLQRTPEDKSFEGLKRYALNRLGRHEERVGLLQAKADRGAAESADLNNLAWYLLVKGAPLEKAMEYAQGAVRTAPRGENNSHHTLASILAEQGRSGDAMKELEAYLGDGDQEPESDAWYVMGRVAENLGEPDWARKYYARVEAPKEAYRELDASHGLVARRLQALGAKAPSGPAREAGSAAR
ncbi:hypothetical protein METEAL_30020 [Mesoterricola silvestris]|uniref:DUF3857 domain-containing protein n=2 Tax=Mesoterricola silvestris TaxID=2927979 RepID=A0AA48H0K9_9BACT|nr:hypothetical protein METEAL_30020 [Mesoterricola silvestris]